MKNLIPYFLLLSLFSFFSCKEDKETNEPANVDPPPIKFEVPSNFPEPTYDLSSNPITREGFNLGKMLFYEGILSKDGTISCGFCHIQNSAFTQHGHPLSHGINDSITTRNSMPVMNLAWNKEFFWDGGVFHLDLFAIEPIQNPKELGESLPNVLEKLRNHPTYPRMFEKAYGTSDITTERFLKALAQFELMCISANSRYDKYKRNEGVELTYDELQGLQLFKNKCATCHEGELFTDFSYRNNGIAIGNKSDFGREHITLKVEDRYKFRVPSLRNIEMTKPYMHDGRFATLERVLDHYSKGVIDSPTLDENLKKNGKLGIEMTEEEKTKIIAFLKTLTDHQFLSDTTLSEF